MPTRIPGPVSLIVLLCSYLAGPGGSRRILAGQGGGSCRCPGNWLRALFCKCSLLKQMIKVFPQFSPQKKSSWLRCLARRDAGSRRGLLGQRLVNEEALWEGSGVEERKAAPQPWEREGLQVSRKASRPPGAPGGLYQARTRKERMTIA